MSYTHNTVPTMHVVAANGVDFTYRRFGNPTGVPLVFVNHYRGNLDTFDPAVTDVMAENREIILFNNAGVASSTGTPKDTLEGMAADAEAFIDALGLTTIDLLGFSMGGMVAQQIVVDRPNLVRKLVLAGTGPRGIKPMPASTVALFSRDDWNPADELWGPVFFSDSDKGKAAAREYLTRTRERQDRDAPTSPEVAAAHAAAAAGWGRPDQSLDYLKQTTQPTLIVNGNNDIVVETVYSYDMYQLIPNARLVLYPDGNHGAHYENHRHFTRELQYFLDVE